jgi:hypothetical protein
VDSLSLGIRVVGEQTIMGLTQTVAICDACWLIEEHGRTPVRFTEPETETCYRCKQETRSGIYVRRLMEEK